jgi:mannose-6-phosphate isomerase-like protein (cupin superfamily)
MHRPGTAMPDPHRPASPARCARWSLDDTSASLPLPATAKWPHGVFDSEVFARAGTSLELFAPRGEDLQTPHAQDEFYIVVAGRAELRVREGDGSMRALPARPGDALYVAAGVEHRFHSISADFAAWVVFFPQAPTP